MGFFVTECNPTLWGLSNDFIVMSRSLQGYARASRFERLGGDVLTLPQAALKAPRRVRPPSQNKAKDRSTVRLQRPTPL